jgi:hypothetical protein
MGKERDARGGRYRLGCSPARETRHRHIRVVSHKLYILHLTLTTPPSTTMSSPVKLYVYDLSNGMVRAMSMQLVGRQIDGIW